MVALDIDWHKPFPLLPLTDQVHIWRAQLDVPDEQILRLRALLNEQEINKVDRLITPILKKRQLLAYAIRRQLLAFYTHCSPQEIVFNFGKHHKPYLGNQNLPALIYFNVTHSHDLALYIFSTLGEVGIDVEWVDHRRRNQSIAKKYFTPKEYQQMVDLPAAQQSQRFYQLWTAKEAYIKTIGLGLSFALNRFEVDLNQLDQPAMSIDGDIASAEQWKLLCFSPQQQYIASAIMSASTRQVSFIDYSCPLFHNT